MSFVDGFFLLAAMMIGVYIPRLLPMGLLAKRTIGKNFQTWLSYIPVAILSALLAPEIFMRNGEFFFAKENLFLFSEVEYRGSGVYEETPKKRRLLAW